MGRGIMDISWDYGGRKYKKERQKSLSNDIVSYKSLKKSLVGSIHFVVVLSSYKIIFGF